jgi:hypothetical protein
LIHASHPHSSSRGKLKSSSRIRQNRRAACATATLRGERSLHHDGVQFGSEGSGFDREQTCTCRESSTHIGRQLRRRFAWHCSSRGGDARLAPHAAIAQPQRGEKGIQRWLWMSRASRALEGNIKCVSGDSGSGMAHPIEICSCDTGGAREPLLVVDQLRFRRTKYQFCVTGANSRTRSSSSASIHRHTRGESAIDFGRRLKLLRGMKLWR